MATVTKRKPRAATAVVPATTIPAIKGMNPDLTCKGFKFEPGQSYEIEGKIIACQNGFHSCPLDDNSPLSVFEYYAPGVSRYFAVEASGETDRHGNKLASAKLTIGVEIGVGKLVEQAIEWFAARKLAKAASNSGDRGAASNSGYRGAASNSGDSGAASNSGYRGAASNSGDRGAAFSHAPYSRVMCEGDGQALYITEFADDGSIKSVACGITGRDGIVAGTWYVCKGGKLVSA